MVWFSSRIIWNLVFLKHLTVWMEACKCYCVPLYFDPFQLKYSVLYITGVLYDDVSCLLVQTLSDRQKQYTQVSLWYHPLHMTDVFIFQSSWGNIRTGRFPDLLRDENKWGTAGTWWEGDRAWIRTALPLRGSGAAARVVCAPQVPEAVAVANCAEAGKE